MQRTPCCGFHFCYRPVRRAGVTRAQTGTKADVVATITNLKMMASKPIWPGDTAFYQKALAEDWTRAIAMEPFTQSRTLETSGRHKEL